MTLEELNLIYLIHKVPLTTFKDEGKNGIAFATVHYTQFTFVDSCLKNTYYSCIQKHRHVGNMLLLLFYCKGFLFM